jgi:DNA-binding GntR family transcriptional regulator
MAAVAERTDGSDLTRRAVEAVREMIVRRELAPGQKIRQVELAARLGVSRSPLREALSSLEAEGLLAHEPQRGYVVARMQVDHLAQIYRMRELLESEVLRTARRPTALDLARLRALNDEIAQALDDGSLTRMLAANRAFHLALFGLSPLGLVRREIERLWNISEPYRAAYLCLPQTRRRVIREHAAMVDALERGDTARLVRLAERHRAAAAATVTALLAAEQP